MKHLTPDDLDRIAKTNDFGGCCLTPLYKSSIDAPLLWRCSYKHEFSRYIVNVQRGYWCDVCRLERKHADREDLARAYAKVNGFTFVTCEHDNQKTICRFVCKFGHQIRRDFTKLNRSNECLTCFNRANTPTADQINNKLTLRGVHLIPESYTALYNNAVFSCLTTPAHGNWTAKPAAILAGGTCGKCSGNIKYTIQDVYNFVAGKDFKCISTVYQTARKPLKWKCLAVGHTWETTFDKIKNGGTRCPSCDGNRPLDISDLKQFAKVVHSGDCLSTTYSTASEIYLWKCENLAHPPFEMSWNNIQQERWCSKCNTHTSKGEIEMYEFSKALIETQIEQHYKLPARESTGRAATLDIYVPSSNIGLEYNGLYWHSEKTGKEKSHHINKLQEAEQVGIRLLQFWDCEWNNKQPIVKDIIRTAFGVKCNTVGARECVVEVIKPAEARKFLDTNHLQGKTKNSIYFGLKNKDVLVQILTLRPIQYTGNDSGWEIGRVATLLGWRIQGGFSKLLNAAKAWLLKNNVHVLFTFADRRYSKGDVYLKNGFEFLGATDPGYWFTKDFTKLVHRYTLRKTKDCPANMTNDEWRKQQGWTKVWDCGQLKFRLKF